MSVSMYIYYLYLLRTWQFQHHLVALHLGFTALYLAYASQISFSISSFRNIRQHETTQIGQEVEA